MFGDLLHGSFLLIFALSCIHYEDQLKDVDNEMFKMPFQGRYLILVMSIMSLYMGFIYNELASVPLNLFGSAWPEYYGDVQPDPEVYTLVHHGGTPYPFGLDPAWRWAEQNIKFTNSLKMKMSIILGVTQMTLGVLLKAVNQIYWKQPKNQPDPDKRYTAGIVLIHESIPELCFFMFTFGYLVILIFAKWSTNWNTAGAGRIEYPRGPPQIINTLIDFAMAKPVEHQNVLLFPESCAPGPEGACSIQTAIQRFLLMGCLVCVPWLLLAKPLLLKSYYARPRSVRAMTQNEGALYHSIHTEPMLTDKDDDESADTADTEFDL